MPDQPPLGLDSLTEAENVLPGTNGYYGSFRQPEVVSTTVPSASASAVVQGALIATLSESENPYYPLRHYVVANGVLLGGGESGFSTLSSVTMNPLDPSDRFGFVQYKNYVVFVNRNNPCQIIEAGQSTAAALATSGSVPQANVVGVVGQFLMVGDLQTPISGNRYPSYVQWSAIDSPRNWPTPNSSAALASQAGEQDLGVEGGNVTAILGGDQFAVILQSNRVTRCTYIGGTAVFQFDQIDNEHGGYYPRSAIRVGDVCYYISKSGFMRTNGVTVENFGAGVVNDYFLSRVNQSAGPLADVTSAYDPDRSQIYWAWPSATAVPTNLLIFNIITQKWSRATVSGGVYALLKRTSTEPYLQAFNTARRLIEFSGAPGTATLTTGETEMNEGGRTFVSGLKPVVDVTANAVTVALGTRDDNQAAVTYTAETTANSRSRYCGFRSDARYHRARVTISGTFNAAQGLQFNAVPSGQT